MNHVCHGPFHNTRHIFHDELICPNPMAAVPGFIVAAYHAAKKKA
jgi:hypothetical protein